VNGKTIYVFYPPYEADITDLMKDGDNSIKVIVTGSLKNTLGPLHGNFGPGAAWPGMFRVSGEKGYPAGNLYNSFDYGLFEDFSLISN
jgi:hypothetical protein